MNASGTSGHSRAVSDPVGFVYFIFDGTAIKIGWAADVEKRLEGLQTGHPGTLELLGAMPTYDPMDEADLHKRFAHLRVKREWFKDDPEIREFIGKLKKFGRYRVMNKYHVIRQARKDLLAWAQKSSDFSVRSRCRIIGYNLLSLADDPDNKERLLAIQQRLNELAEGIRNGGFG